MNYEAPYHATGHYSIPGRYAQHYELGIRYICKHGIQETYKNQQGSNIGTTYQPFKNIDKKIDEINKIAGDNTSPVPSESIKEG